MAILPEFATEKRDVEPLMHRMMRVGGKTVTICVRKLATSLLWGLVVPGILATSLLFPGSAQGQVVVRPWYRPYGYHGYGYGGHGYGGGTAAGNYMQGMSSVIRAEGQYNLLTSQAGINYEESRSKYLDNKKKWTENYYQMREDYQARSAAAHEAAKHSPEALAAAAKSGVPRKLGPEAFDPVTGHITWPEALAGDDYAALRKEVEQQFELRAKTSQAAGIATKIRAATAEMSTKLRQNIQKMSANEYLSGRKFLDSLDYAAQPRI